MNRPTKRKSIWLAGIALLILGQALPVLAQCDCQGDCGHGCCSASPEPQPQETGACCAQDSDLTPSASEGSCLLDSAHSSSPLSLTSAECSCMASPVPTPLAAVTGQDSPAGKRMASVAAFSVMDGLADLLPISGRHAALAQGAHSIPAAAIYLVNSSFLA